MTAIHRTEATGGVTPFETPRFTIEVLAGMDVGAKATSVDGSMTVGTAQDATLRLTDPTVSRYHIECSVTPEGVLIRDLGSTNGTLFASAVVREVIVRTGVELHVGRTRLRVLLARERVPMGVSSARSFGRLLGGSVAMRTVYTALERAAPSVAPVLITGESGTGKELAAHALHAASPRAGGPFEIVDCGGLPPTLIESELFGHERGAFTGAVAEREGAFERADGGTVFLDELGELPLEVQPKLLRALGEREVRRVGGRRTRKVDVRVVAATHRDLRREVNAGRFRADLFYRIAVVQVRMPPLRERLEDLPDLVTALLSAVRPDRSGPGVTVDADLLTQLTRHAWPGNVRELRNYLEQYAVLREAPLLTDPDTHTLDPTPSLPLDVQGFAALPLRQAKAALVEQFERQYVALLLEQTGGNISEAARRAGVDRVTLFRTLRRYGLRRDE